MGDWFRGEIEKGGDKVSDQENKPKSKDIYIALNVAHMKQISWLGM
jgi:hypothetical protein